jgi:hypothetical protein
MKRAALVGALMCMWALSGPASADKFIVPRWSVERLPELTRLMAPSEPRVSTATWFSGRVIELVYLAGETPTKHPMDRVQLRIEPISWDGSKVGEPVLIPGSWLAWHNAFDHPMDLTRLLSNRHELAGIQCGSPEHRAMLLGLIDPDGSLNVGPGGPARPIQGTIEEGSLIHYLLTGGPASTDEQMALLRSRPHDPRLLAAAMSQIDQAILEGLARVQRYPQLHDPALEQQLIATLGFLIELAAIDPDIAPAGQAAIAERAQMLGTEALRRLASVDFARYPAPGPLDALPLQQFDRMKAILTVMSTDPVFDHLYPWAVDEVETPLYHRSDNDAQWIMSSLLRVAADDEKSPIQAPPELRDLARRVLLRLFNASPDPADAPERQFPWRADIIGQLMSDDAGRRKFVLELCYEAGWGEPMPTLLLAEAALSAARDAVPRVRDEPPGDTDAFLIVAALLDSAGRANVKPAVDYLEAKLQEFRAAAQVDPDPTGRAWFNRQFLDLYEQGLRQWKASRPAPPSP